MIKDGFPAKGLVLSSGGTHSKIAGGFCILIICSVHLLLISHSLLLDSSLVEFLNILLVVHNSNYLLYVSIRKNFWITVPNLHFSHVAL
jgi:hypothetical protein